MPDYDWGPDEPEVAEKRKRAKRRRAAAKARPKDSPGDAAIMLSLVTGRGCAAGRSKRRWRR